jgi:methylglutamate dehydrogenase subunit B
MRVQCPFCGERDSNEFTFLGDASCRRPDSSSGVESFFRSLYVRENPAGRHAELWYHSGGCRYFLKVFRDTRTHEIFSAELASETQA